MHRNSLRIWLSCFNPRAREGRDSLPNKADIQVSSFNPRAREGRDQTLKQEETVMKWFQSTRP